MASNFDKQLEKILNDDVGKVVDNLQDNNTNEEESIETTEEMKAVLYDDKESSTQLSNHDLQSDYNSARSNLYGLMGKSNAAIELTLKIALMSEHPRALEVASSLIKTSSDISKELISLHKSIEKEQKKEDVASSYTQNNYYMNDKKEDVEGMVDDLPDDDKKE